MKKIIFLSVFLILTTLLSAQPVDQKDEPLTAATAKRGPIITGCEKYKEDSNELYKCFSQTLGKYLVTVMDSDYELAENQKVRVLLSFTIDADGQLLLLEIKQGNAPQNIVDNATDSFNKLIEAVKAGRIEIQPAIDMENKPQSFNYSLPIVYSAM